MTLDEKTKARIASFVQRFVASGEPGSSLPSPITFYGPNVRFNGKPVTHEFIQSQIDTAFRTFPQRSWQFISGPTVTPAQDSPGATVNYELSGVFSNGVSGMQAKLSMQMTGREAWRSVRNRRYLAESSGTSRSLNETSDQVKLVRSNI